jgi:hypothetical protein
VVLGLYGGRRYSLMKVTPTRDGILLVVAVVLMVGGVVLLLADAASGG